MASTPSRVSTPPAVVRGAAVDSPRAAARDDALADSVPDSVAVEDPFRPPTAPRSVDSGAARCPSLVSVPSERCRLAASGAERACLAAYVAIGDAPMQRAFDAVVIELRRAAGVAATAPDPPSVERVRVEQRVWLSVRGSECRRQPTVDDGPFWAPVHAQCYNEMAVSRASELQDAVRRLRRR